MIISLSIHQLLSDMDKHNKFLHVPLSFACAHHTFHKFMYIHASILHVHVYEQISEDVDPAHHVPDSGPPPQITNQISTVSHISLVWCSAILQSSLISRPQPHSHKNKWPGSYRSHMCLIPQKFWGNCKLLCYIHTCILHNVYCGSWSVSIFSNQPSR